MKLSSPKPRTILDDVEPSTDAERAEWEKQRAREWADRALPALLAYAKHNRSFAQYLCENVADQYGTDDQLSAVITNRIRIDRKGKKRGKRLKWDYARYYQLLVHFRLARQEKAYKEAVEELAEVYGVTTRTIEKKITSAGKAVNSEDLPEFLPNPQ